MTGTAAASSATALDFTGPVAGTSTFYVSANATLEFDSAVANSVTVNFESGTGTLDLTQPEKFAGTIEGFTGTAANSNSSDVIDLAGINYNSASFIESYNSNTGVLTVSDGTNSASLTFLDFTGTFKFASDGNGGTYIYDPPGTVSSSPSSNSGSVSIGGAGNDTFVFHPGMGAETINNFNPQADHIELDHFANVQNLQQLAADITSNAHGDALIELGHGDSVTVAGMTAAQLQAHLQSFVHLH